MSEEKITLDLSEQSRSTLIEDLRRVLGELARARDEITAEDGDIFPGPQKNILIHARTFDVITSDDDFKIGEWKGKKIDYYMLLSDVHKKVREELKTLEIEGRVKGSARGKG